MTPRLARRPADATVLQRWWRSTRSRLDGWLSARRRTIRLSGPYVDWAAAAAASQGYDSYQIISRTRAAARRVANGEAVYERDSVLFDRVHYSWPLLSGLLWVAAQHGGALNVLDYGGALGSSRRQNHAFLRELPACRWNIVEQLPYVDIGRAEFSRDGLHFYASIAECLHVTSPQIALLSSVLNYVPQPEAVLAELAASAVSYLLIDRTYVCDAAEDRIYVQHVPPTIYRASYPCRIFSAARLRELIERDWEIVAEFGNNERLTRAVKHRSIGLIARRRRPAGVPQFNAAPR